MTTSTHPGVHAPGASPVFDPAGLHAACQRFRESVCVVQDPHAPQLGVAFGQPEGYQVVGMLPPLYPEWLGDRSFGAVHQLRFPYVCGAMANGIATTTLVAAAARGGFLGFFGAAGLPLHRIESAVDELQKTLDPEGLPWGSNLIHSPNEPELEESAAELYIARGVRRVSASAYMNLTPAIVRYAASGLHLDAAGHVQRRHFVFAKISRPEVARRFLEPPPQKMLDGLVAQGKLTTEEARLAALLPVAEDYTVEADSGGHTDNQTLTALFPIILALRDEIAQERGYTRPIRIGAAGGLGTPTALAAAFSLGAAYCLTGSVNQACVESGLHERGRLMLAGAGLADVVMAPAADMFELGVDVQVLKRGTMFSVRARKLYELYRTYESLEAIPADERAKVERDMLRATFEEAWASTREFWLGREAAQVERAERDSRHLMALVFRSYLGLSSRWAIVGDGERETDYQIWCGPAMGAFNAWTRGTFLAEPGNRSVVQVGYNLLEGAAAVTRAQQLRAYGLSVPAAAFDFRPRPLE